MLFMGGVVGRAVPRIRRDDQLAILVSGVRLADADADAGSRFLKHAARRDTHGAALSRIFERGFDALLGGYDAALDMALR